MPLPPPPAKKAARLDLTQHTIQTLAEGRSAPARKATEEAVAAPAESQVVAQLVETVESSPQVVTQNVSTPAALLKPPASKRRSRKTAAPDTSTPDATTISAVAASAPSIGTRCPSGAGAGPSRGYPSTCGCTTCGRCQTRCRQSHTLGQGRQTGTPRPHQAVCARYQCAAARPHVPLPL